MLLLLWAGLLWAGIPVAAASLRAGIVLSFTIPFALVSLFTGDSGRAAELLTKSYLSALAVLLLVSTTPVSLLLRGMEAAGLPRFLLMVAQFLYRYLFVIADEAQLMRTAALARGSTPRGMVGRPTRFRAAAGTLGALFA